MSREGFPDASGWIQTEVVISMKPRSYCIRSKLSKCDGRPNIQLSDDSFEAAKSRFAWVPRCCIGQLAVSSGYFGNDCLSSSARGGGWCCIKVVK